MKTGTPELTSFRGVGIFLLRNKTIKKRLSREFRIQVNIARPKEGFKGHGSVPTHRCSFLGFFLYFMYSFISMNDFFQERIVLMRQ